ncbi:hypothetical protein GCM10022297_04060 [Lactobacillus hamsteri]|uniref:Uncharacterized protein n=1 Tax=Lactobacillus hamsteri DSM 5661 = JCM 6256 TaxID=1423754 RepID=A0A0R1Y4Q7_9LACO|nr:hypothetical protein [Lactobacillus hamsteri]KRM37210.1 hypothetical protein FC39_GL000318 [Lactobacillus hamsteri DSM 5661 = JCM 6256]
MTEKRSDYRKKQNQRKPKNFFQKMKAAFDDSDIDQEDVDVNPDFQRDPSERRPLDGNGIEDINQNIENIKNINATSEDKRLRLKKRLNSAILIVFVLIILVLLALFHL